MFVKQVASNETKSLQVSDALTAKALLEKARDKFGIPSEIEATLMLNGQVLPTHTALRQSGLAGNESLQLVGENCLPGGSRKSADDDDY